MIRFAKREYFNLKLWYYNLSNVFKMKVTIIGLIMIVLFNFGFIGKLQYEKFIQNRNVEVVKKENKELNDYIEIQDSLIEYQEKQNENIKEFAQFILKQRPYINRLTGYHPVPEQTDNTPDITADGTKFDINRAGEYRYVALSRDQLNKWGGNIHFGDFVLITNTPGHKQDGVYQVRDTMNKRHTEWIDILLSPGEQSFYYKKVVMYKIPQETFFTIKDGLQEFYDRLPQLEPLAVMKPEI